jgi:class 3 adenylate cyclase
MLFTDIEGSTALLSRLGERYVEALSAQRTLMRAAISAWWGREMGTEGDSFFVVFASAADAVSCAVAAQRALAGLSSGRALSQAEALALLLSLSPVNHPPG